jgi:hypothetical protein
MAEDGARQVSLVRVGPGRYQVRNTRGGSLTIGSGANDEFTPVELLPAAIRGGHGHRRRSDHRPAGRRPALNQRLLVRLCRHPEDDHVGVTLSGVGGGRVWPGKPAHPDRAATVGVAIRMRPALS